MEINSEIINSSNGNLKTAKQINEKDNLLRFLQGKLVLYTGKTTKRVWELEGYRPFWVPLISSIISSLFTTSSRNDPFPLLHG